MKLSTLAINKINNPSTRMKLVVLLGCSEFTILRYIKNNDDNLTKAAVIRLIKKETGLKIAEILEDDTKGIAVKVLTVSGKANTATNN